MRSGTIAFLLGVVLFCTRETLLPLGGLFVLLCGAALVLFFFSRGRVIAFGLAGFLWCAVYAQSLAPPSWLATYEGRDLVVSGTVASIPRHTGRAWRFRLRLDSVYLLDGPVASDAEVRLNWYRLPAGVALVPGQRWRLSVRLKRPRGYASPGSFDYEAWLYQRGIRATGYVRTGSARLLAGSHGEMLTRLRWRLRQRVHAALADAGGEGARDNAGILVALLTGFRGDLDPAQRRLLQRTGTAHLIAISGLHVGLVAGMAFWLARRLWRWLPGLQSRWPAPVVAAWLAMAAAGAYAALAGFSIPTQRAFIMTAVVMGLLAWQVRLPWRDVVLLALAAVLVRDPLAVLSWGFWLSFGAVTLIALVLAGRVGLPPSRAGWWWRAQAWWRVQVAMLAGLLPLGSALFGYIPLWSPLANLVAIPLVGMLVVPLCLLAAMLAGWPDAAGVLLRLAAWLLDLLWPLLAALDGLPQAVWPVARSGWSAVALVMAGLGSLWLLAPRGWPRRGLGAVLLLPLLFTQADRPAAGDYRATVLDVGQGLAVVVETARHVLVYDAGPRFGPRFDTGAAVVAPFLHRRGRTHVDTLVVSHLDNDHAGGVVGLSEAVPIDRVLGSAPVVLPGGRPLPRQVPCSAGQHWQWDGVRFHMLYPAPETPVGAGENDRSCVLLIAGRDGQAGRMLLTGDIEAATEARLVARYGPALRATVLVVPHHGSNTSSTRAFLHAVAPRVAIAAAGYRNRYHFPTARIRRRYARLGIPLFDTITSGAITLRWSRHGQPRLTHYRQRHRHFWQGSRQ